MLFGFFRNNCGYYQYIYILRCDLVLTYCECLFLGSLCPFTQSKQIYLFEENGLKYHCFLVFSGKISIHNLFDDVAFTFTFI